MAAPFADFALSAVFGVFAAALSACEWSAHGAGELPSGPADAAPGDATVDVGSPEADVAEAACTPEDLDGQVATQNGGLVALFQGYGGTGSIFFYGAGTPLGPSCATTAVGACTWTTDCPQRSRG